MPGHSGMKDEDRPDDPVFELKKIAAEHLVYCDNMRKAAAEEKNEQVQRLFETKMIWIAGVLERARERCGL